MFTAYCILDINLEEKELEGWTDYSTTVPLGRNKTVTNPIRMPIIGVKQIKSTVVISALTTLEIVTGQNFGRNIPQWRKWWNENRDSFPKE